MVHVRPAPIAVPAIGAAQLPFEADAALLHVMGDRAYRTS
jgi:hypothetical protein